MIVITFPAPLYMAFHVRIGVIARSVVNGDLSDDQVDYEMKYLVRQVTEAHLLLEQINTILHPLS